MDSPIGAKLEGALHWSASCGILGLLEETLVDELGVPLALLGIHECPWPARGYAIAAACPRRGFQLY
jgi:hypothetical protein